MRVEKKQKVRRKKGGGRGAERSMTCEEPVARGQGLHHDEHLTFTIKVSEMHVFGKRRQKRVELKGSHKKARVGETQSGQKCMG